MGGDGFDAVPAPFDSDEIAGASYRQRAGDFRIAARSGGGQARRRSLAAPARGPGLAAGRPNPHAAAAFQHLGHGFEAQGPAAAVQPAEGGLLLAAVLVDGVEVGGALAGVGRAGGGGVLQVEVQLLAGGGPGCPRPRRS